MPNNTKNKKTALYLLTKEISSFSFSFSESLETIESESSSEEELSSPLSSVACAPCVSHYHEYELLINVTYFLSWYGENCYADHFKLFFSLDTFKIMLSKDKTFTLPIFKIIKSVKVCFIFRMTGRESTINEIIQIARNLS